VAASTAFDETSFSSIMAAREKHEITAEEDDTTLPRERENMGWW
jgi:hypothetical protein